MKTKLRSILTFTAAFSLAASILHAETQVFDFKDPKGVNNVRFQLDAPLESIAGTSTGVSGHVHYDRSAPESTKGRIVIDTASLTVGNPLMREHLHGEGWLNVKQHPSIIFEVMDVDNVRGDADDVTADVTGNFTLKGVTKNITVPVRFTYLADRLGARVNDESVKGDLLVLRSNFEINRSEFGIKPGQNTDKVAETIEISLAIAGASPRE